MKLDKLSDKELAKIANNIEAENKRRANRKAAAMAIIAVLKRHKLSIGDIPELELGKRPSKTGRKRAVAAKTRRLRAKPVSAKKTGKRLKVSYKYKNPNGPEKMGGRGRSPKWINTILKNNNISIAQFKSDERYKI